jgi:hypothetical protein
MVVCQENIQGLANRFPAVRLAHPIQEFLP